MSLHIAAQHLASKGRGPDTELIHMTKGEIAGLQALAKAAGGSLTINPDTGLAEAGFLKSLLPTLIGAGLAVATGGTSLALTPGMIGLGMGGIETLRTGDLKKGLLAGMGGYGGAGLASGLMAAGTNAAQNAAMEGAKAGAGEAAAQSAQAANPQLMGSEIGREMGQAGYNAGQTAAQLQAQAAADATRQAMGMNAAGTVDMAGIGSRLGTAGEGLTSLGSEAGRNAFGAYTTGAGTSATRLGLAAAAPGIADALTPKMPGATKADAYMGPRYRFEAGVATPFPETPSTGNEREYFPEQKYTRLSEADAKALYGYADGGDVQFPYGESVLRMAQGGISDLGGYSDGGRLLRGPGDGVSDSIPATIGQKQPARLADGEFVVPARIVSELGNGSTDAGARQLYKMMDRVQKARTKTTGKGKIAKNTNAAKHLPA